jgi:hypothetical protein
MLFSLSAKQEETRFRAFNWTIVSFLPITRMCVSLALRGSQARHHTTQQIISQFDTEKRSGFIYDEFSDVYSRLVEPDSIEDQMCAFESLEKILSDRSEGWERFGDVQICHSLVHALTVDQLQENAAWLLCYWVSLFTSTFPWLFELGAVAFLVERLHSDPLPISFLHLVTEIVENCEFDPIFIPLIPRLIGLISEGIPKCSLDLCLRMVAVLTRVDSVRQICIELNLLSILLQRRHFFTGTSTDLAFKILVQFDCVEEEFIEWAVDVVRSEQQVIKHASQFLRSLSFDAFLKLSKSGAIVGLSELPQNRSASESALIGAVLFAFLQSMLDNGRAERESCGRPFAVAVRSFSVMACEDILGAFGVVAALIEDSDPVFLAIAIESELPELLTDLCNHKDERVTQRAAAILRSYF